MPTILATAIILHFANDNGIILVLDIFIVDKEPKMSEADCGPNIS